MPTKKAKAALAANKSKIHKLTYHVKGAKDTEDYLGVLKNESGIVLFTILENEDYNQLSRLLSTSKYMKDEHDMKGLAEYVFDRDLLGLEPEEKEEWKKKKQIPIDIKEVSVL